MTVPPRDSGLLLLTCFGLGVTIAAAAFAIHPVRASPLVFWIVISVAATVVAVGLVGHLRSGGSRQHLVASECRRICAAIANLLAEQESLRPKPGRFGNSYERLEKSWLSDTAGRYERELRPWANKIFDQAVKAGVISEASRPLLRARSPLQLLTLRSLFLEAAESLEQI